MVQYISMASMSEQIIHTGQLRVDVAQGNFLKTLKDEKRFLEERDEGKIIDAGHIDSGGNAHRTIVGSLQTIRAIFSDGIPGQTTDVVRLDISQEDLVKELFEITPSIAKRSQRGREFSAAVTEEKLLDIGHSEGGQVVRTIIGPEDLITRIFSDIER